MLRNLSLAILLMIGSGCTPETVSEPVALPLPARPHLEIITDQDNSWLRDNNESLHEKMVINDSRLKGHIRKLEGIIRATH